MCERHDIALNNRSIYPERWQPIRWVRAAVSTRAPSTEAWCCLSSIYPSPPAFFINGSRVA